MLPIRPLGTVHITADGRTLLRFVRHLAHPPEKVWRALTEWEHLQAWFPAVIKFDLTPGAPLRFAPTPEQQARFGLSDLDSEATNGVMTRVEPPHLLEYTWGDEVLRWELTADGEGGCQLVFTNLLADRDTAVAAAAGWHTGLDVVEAQLDARPLPWSIWERAEQLAADYATHLD